MQVWNLDTLGGSLSPFCPSVALHTLGHHAATCKHGGDVVTRDIFAAFCHRAHLSVKVEVGYGLGTGHVTSRPEDVLVPGWDMRPDA